MFPDFPWFFSPYLLLIAATLVGISVIAVCCLAAFLLSSKEK